MLLERAHHASMALLTGCGAIEKTKCVQLALTSEGGHFAEEHLVDQGLLLRRLLKLLQCGLLIQEVEVGIHHVLLGHEEEELLLVHGLLLRVAGYLRQELLLLLKLLVEAARVPQSAIEVQCVTRILVSKKHRLLILR